MAAFARIARILKPSQGIHLTQVSASGMAGWLPHPCATCYPDPCSVADQKLFKVSSVFIFFNSLISWPLYDLQATENWSLGHRHTIANHLEIYPSLGDQDIHG